MISVLLSLFISLSAQARITVAFLEVRDYNGKVVQLEPGGQFAHVAISYKDGWLHAHPVRGVEFIHRKTLERIGAIKVGISLPNAPEITEAIANKYLGKAYDSEFSWTDDKMYCSELVAKILGFPPEPMYFDPKLWPPQYDALNGLPGISPDDLYERLK